MENGKYTKVKDSDFEAKNEVPIPSKIGIGTASKPPDRTFCESIRIFFYNSENGSFCSRTPKSWCQILLFFLCFYAVLFGLWALWMYAFLMSLPETASGPKYMLGGSLIGTNPGDYVIFSYFSRKKSVTSRLLRNEFNCQLVYWFYADALKATFVNIMWGPENKYTFFYWGPIINDAVVYILGTCGAIMCCIFLDFGQPLRDWGTS